MGIMPDSWIRKMAEEKGMIDPFIDKLEKKMSYLMVFLLMDTMLEFLRILKFLLTLIPQLLIQKVFQNQALLIEMLTLVLYHQIVLH